MMAASEEMQFEKAIEYRDLLNSVKQIAQKQKITHNDGEDKDIIALASDDRDAVVQVFFIRDGKLIGRDHFYVRVGTEDTKSQILTTFLKQFCCTLRCKHLHLEIFLIMKQKPFLLHPSQ